MDNEDLPYTLYNGDNVIKMGEMIEDESIDLIEIDPPYFLRNDSGLGFMNAKWDSINKEEYEKLLPQFRKLKDFVEKLFDNSQDFDLEDIQDLDEFRKIEKYKELILKDIPTNPIDLTAMNVRLFHYKWLKQAYRVLKEGHFMFILYSPRQDTMRDLLNAIHDSGFYYAFTSMDWLYNQGMTKASNLVTAWDNRLFMKWLNKVGLIEDYNSKNKEIKNEKDKEKRVKLQINFDKWKREMKQKWAMDEYNKKVVYAFEEDQHWGRKNRSYETSANIFSQDRKNDKVKMNKKKTLPNFSGEQYGFTGKRVVGYEGERIEEEPEYIVIDYNQHHSEGRKDKAGAGHDFFTEFDEIGKYEGVGDGKIQSKAISPQAKMLEGYYAGFQPSPSKEEILVCMKPTKKKIAYMDQAFKNKGCATRLGKTKIPVGENDVNIDRNYSNGNSAFPSDFEKSGHFDQSVKHMISGMSNNNAEGRFLSNIIELDDCLQTPYPFYKLELIFCEKIRKLELAQFPYLSVPKPTKLEKNLGLKDFESKKVRDGRKAEVDKPHQRGETLRKNIHPTIKPIMLGTLLTELGSEEGDVVLDCFSGSGSFLIGAVLNGRKAIGIDLNPDFVKISESRLDFWLNLMYEVKEKKLSFIELFEYYKQREKLRDNDQEMKKIARNKAKKIAKTKKDSDSHIVLDKFFGGE